MEKNYAERVMEIKSEILKEIRELLPDGETHKFENTFYVHYVSGEVATTEVCMAVTNDCGSIGFNVAPDDVVADVTDNFVDGVDIFNFEPNTFMDVLENLRKELREKKLAKLREIVKNAGGRIKFDGKFDFNLLDERNGCEVWPCYLESLYIDDTDSLIVDNKFDGGGYTNGSDCLMYEELDRIIDYAEKESEKNFSLTDAQARALHEFIVAARNLHSAGVSIIRDNVTDNLYFVNGERVEEFMNEEHVVPVKDITDIVNSAPSLLSICDAAFYFNEEKIFAKMRD